LFLEVQHLTGQNLEKLEVTRADCPRWIPGLSAGILEEIYLFWTDSGQQGRSAKSLMRTVRVMEPDRPLVKFEKYSESGQKGGSVKRCAADRPLQSSGPSACGKMDLHRSDVFLMGDRFHNRGPSATSTRTVRTRRAQPGNPALSFDSLLHPHHLTSMSKRPTPTSLLPPPYLESDLHPWEKLGRIPGQSVIILGPSVTQPSTCHPGIGSNPLLNLLVSCG
jgi:hypothetical protein